MLCVYFYSPLGYLMYESIICPEYKECHKNVFLCFLLRFLCFPMISPIFPWFSEKTTVHGRGENSRKLEKT